jgi:cytochrome c-type biogenesis protein CcmE
MHEVDDDAPLVLDDPEAADAAASMGETPQAFGHREVEPAVPRPSPRAAGIRIGTTRWRLLAVGAVLVGAFVFLLVQGLGGSLDYFETVDQAMQHKAMLGGSTFRLEGLVEPGSIHTTPDGVSFVAGGSTFRVPVVNHGNPPQLFQPNVPVVVVGHFSGDTFFSNQIIVDHTAQYREQHPKRVQAPNGTVR